MNKFKWINAKDKLPDKNGQYAVVWHGCYYLDKYYAVLWFDAKNKKWLSPDRSRTSILYWMPLPELPELPE